MFTIKMVPIVDSNIYCVLNVEQKLRLGMSFIAISKEGQAKI